MSSFHSSIHPFMTCHGKPCAKWRGRWGLCYSVPRFLQGRKPRCLYDNDMVANLCTAASTSCFASSLWALATSSSSRGQVSSLDPFVSCMYVYA